MNRQPTTRTTSGVADSILDWLEEHEVVTGPLTAGANEWLGYDVFDFQSRGGQFVRFYWEDPEGDVRVVVMDGHGVHHHAAQFSAGIYESTVATFICGLFGQIR